MKFWQPIWLMLNVILFCKLSFVLFHVKLLPAKNGCKTKVAFILKYLTAKYVCQLKVADQKKKKGLPAKTSCQTKVATSQEWKPLKKRKKQYDCYYKLAVKVGCQKKRLPAKSNYPANAVQANSYCQTKSKTWLPAKSSCQPNAGVT